MTDDIEEYDSIEEYIRDQMEDGIEVTAEDFEGRDCAHCGETIPFTEFPDGVVTWDVPVHDPDEPEPEPYYARYYYCSEDCKSDAMHQGGSDVVPDMIHVDDIDDESLIADGGTEQESSEQHTVIEAECLEDGCEELEEVTHLAHARTDRQTEMVLDAHVEAARLHEEEAGHEFNVSVETGTPSEMEGLYEDLTGERLVADGGTEQESAEVKHPDEETARRYLCTDCESVVRARWHSPGSFSVGCDCTTVPVVPQMGQYETPDNWVVERNECCRGMDVKEMDTVYGGEPGQDYECPDCGSTYNWDGSLVTAGGSA